MKMNDQILKAVQKYKKQQKPRFQFSNVVVVNNDCIGVILKTWGREGEYNYDIYVRYYGEIKNYKESEIKHYIYSKELQEDEIDLYD